MKLEFTQNTNQETYIQSVVDNYEGKINDSSWLAVGLQKDAIQNCWDARVSTKKGKNWECGFSLMKIQGEEMLCIVDRGTRGLNGTIFETEAELADILRRVSEGDKGEDLACFLNSNWSAKSEEDGGSRGRGKTLFLWTSRLKKIYFDSLRSSDKSYVFGEIYLDKDDKQVKFSFECNEKGYEAFESEFNSELTPIDHCGTRVFIPKPKNEVVQAIKDGEFIDFIENSRWEIVKKHNAKIFVHDGKKKTYAKCLRWYDDGSLKGVRGKEYPPQTIGDGYKTKRLVLRYAPGVDVPESVHGIAIQRGGMTIERKPTERLVKEQGMGDIYGWLEMDKDLEAEMKRCEGPEHLDFRWTTNPARPLLAYIKLSIREFAKELKINESERAKESKAQKDAGEQAVKLLAPQFKELGLHGKHKGKGLRKKADYQRKKKEPLRLSAPDFKFPKEDTRRVDYGEKIEGTYVIPINDFDEEILVSIVVRIVSEKGREISSEEKTIKLCTGESAQKIGPEHIFISNEYARGGYSLRARMKSMENKSITLADGSKITFEKGDQIYNPLNRKFYVDVDPPESGPLEFKPNPKADAKGYLLEWILEDEGYVVYYNSLHPHIEPLVKDEEKLKDYLLEQGSLIAVQIKIEELVADGNDGNDEEFTKLIEDGNVAEVYELLLDKHSRFLWDIHKNSKQ